MSLVGFRSLTKKIEGDIFNLNGMWRSLGAHLNGVQGAVGSNPTIPISQKGLGCHPNPFCFLRALFCIEKILE